MNKPESFITNLFKENNLSIVYTGDGRFPISRLEPDWICINTNKLIDFFGTYYHINEDENERRRIFEKEGYDYLVIWEGEEKNPEELIRKVKSFLNPIK
jgi:very-short-patch-repair endonuclease